MTVGFNSSGYTAAENEREVSVCVFAAASTTSATSTVSVSLSVTGGSAGELQQQHNTHCIATMEYRVYLWSYTE